MIQIQSRAFYNTKSQFHEEKETTNNKSKYYDDTKLHQKDKHRKKVKNEKNDNHVVSFLSCSVKKNFYLIQICNVTATRIS